MAVILKHVAM